MSFFLAILEYYHSYEGDIGQLSALKFVKIRQVSIDSSHFSNNAGTVIDCQNQAQGHRLIYR